MRIIAGKNKGTKLYEFEYDNIRPTLDRVRESIFNTLQTRINDDSEVLDLFCGTGAFSLEFLSRGAKTVISVDNNPNSISLIKKNFAKCKIEPNLLECDYKKALKTLCQKQFDIIFLDPPFESNYAQKAIEKIVETNMLKENGVVVWEKHIDTPSVDFDGLCVLDEKKYGTICVVYYGRSND